MTSSLPPKSPAVRLLVCRGLLLLVIGLLVCCVPDPALGQWKGGQYDGVAAAGHADAVPSNAGVHQPLLGLSVYQILGNKTRMIQVATLFMIVGIMFLLWGKSK